MSRILDPLKRSQSGTAIYQHITSISEQFENENIEAQNAYADLLRELIESLAREIPHQSPLQTHLSLILLQLTPPLSAAEITTMRLSLRSQAMAAAVVDNNGHDQRPYEQALTALTDSYDATVTPGGEPTADMAPADMNMEQAATSPPPQRNLPSYNDTPERRVDQTYRRHLNDKRDRIQNIQQTLTQHVNEVTKQNREFGTLLEAEYNSLHKSGDIQELHTLKQSLLQEVKKLLVGNRSITDKLDKAKNYLKLIEQEGQHLNEELTRVHLLSLTDELTELPNRRAFMRRLEDEVSRVQRYGSTLSMALLDMDSFKAINDKLGHPVGDEVLRTFSTNVLSIFRHHDMVARYGGEEFAILLPNTDTHGTLRALEKVQERAANTHFQANDTSLPIPTFSAGIALYKPGEPPGIMIERADKALYRAKELGRNRIEIAVSDNPSAAPGAV